MSTFSEEQLRADLAAAKVEFVDVSARYDHLRQLIARLESALGVSACDPEPSRRHLAPQNFGTPIGTPGR